MLAMEQPPCLATAKLMEPVQLLAIAKIGQALLVPATPV